MKVKQEIRDKIFTAATALASEGMDNPTNDQVRERMGGGSLSHISPVMREWRESRKAEIVAALDIPADLKKTIETSVSQVWASASKLAAAAIETTRQEADAVIEAATAERDEALAEIDRLETRIAERDGTLADKTQLIDQAKAELEHVRGQCVKLTTESAALEARLVDRNEQIKGLKTELKESRNDNKVLQGELIDIARKVKA
ncbi:MAG: chromosome segregation ATPase [Gammaproteobacteria bacterium]|jgi:chromosome segregation ATPase